MHESSDVYEEDKFLPLLLVLVFGNTCVILQDVRLEIASFPFVPSRKTGLHPKSRLLLNRVLSPALLLRADLMASSRQFADNPAEA